MTDGVTAVECSNCGHSFTDREKAKNEPAHQCPECGSTARTVHLRASDTATVHDSLKLKGRAASGGKPFIELEHEKLEWFRKLGRWHLVTRVINRRDDQYDELIVDRETGQVVREIHEPLSQHRGHGTARQPKQ